MKLFYDLHIHSALSPCADDDMTPNNIVNMAMIKGLDVIAVCDHNCTANIPAVWSVAEQAGILFIPGIEITTAEEAHLLAYFHSAEQAVAFGNIIYDSLPDIENSTEYFGNQLILNAEDEILGQKKKMLLSATPFSLNECCTLIQEYDGVPVPAHINKEADSIMANLGFMPQEIDFVTIEMWRNGMEFDASGYRTLFNSDAHTLEQIAERDSIIIVDTKSVTSVLYKIGSR